MCGSYEHLFDEVNDYDDDDFYAYGDDFDDYEDDDFDDEDEDDDFGSGPFAPARGAQS